MIKDEVKMQEAVRVMLNKTLESHHVFLTNISIRDDSYSISRRDKTMTLDFKLFEKGE